jgi:hypothetical protein
MQFYLKGFFECFPKAIRLHASANILHSRGMITNLSRQINLKSYTLVRIPFYLSLINVDYLFLLFFCTLSPEEVAPTAHGYHFYLYRSDGIII